MAEKNTSANVLVCETQEALYKKAVKKMKADRLIVQHAFKIENYMTAAAMFDEVGAYMDSAELAAKCRELAEVTRAEQRESLYQKAVEMKEKALTEGDYQKAVALFAELKDYKEAAKEKEACEQKIQEFDRKIKRKWTLICGAAVVAAGLVIAGFATGFFKYSMGVCYSSMGYYEKAEDIFSNLNGLLDSQAKALECQEKVLKQQEAEQLHTLQKADAGDKVVFGSNQWTVLERREEQICLVLEKVAKNSLFYQVSYDETGETADWEEASLNKWLNTEVLNTVFDEEELSALVPLAEWPVNENTKLGTEKDYLTIPDAELTEQYQKQMKHLTEKDYWLRDQGADDTMAAFVSAAGEIMEYGYPTAAKMSVCPVIVVDCSKLTEEEGA